MASDFSIQIMEALQEYNHQVDRTMKEILPAIAKEAAKQIQGSAPKKSGSYARGWRQQTTLSALGVESVVYNARLPGLTQLLEKGHAKRGGGRVPSAAEHIKPAEEWVKTEAVKRLEEALR